MEVVDFTVSHIAEAKRIALQNYNAERTQAPALPPIDCVPDLTPYAENGLGIAAFDDGEMVGFLCCVPPFQNAFRSTDAVGVFSPMGANGAIGKNRAAVYARMYQAAGDKWVKAGASSHAVCLYAHDKEAQEQFFRYGFGMRTVDAIRVMDEIAAISCPEVTFSELDTQDLPELLPLYRGLVAHLEQSPSFMRYAPKTDAETLNTIAAPGARYFTALLGGRHIAYIKISGGGENFACDVPDMQSICGAFCLPEYRGKGAFQDLLNYMIRTLKAEGYTRLGVDFESFNPTAWGYWLKYFSAYTYGIVRRIDEYAIARLQY